MQTSTLRLIISQRVEFQEAGLGTSGSMPKYVVKDDDGGHGRTTAVGGVLRPTPMFPRRSPTLVPQLELESRELWKQFNDLTTEMIITKSGRSVSEPYV